MGQIAGHKWWSVGLAAIAIFAVGAIWYSALFAEAWMVAKGYTIEQLEANNPAWLAAGIVMPVLIALGFAFLLHWRNAQSLGSALVTAGLAWLFFALPVLAYTLVYSVEHSLPLLAVDGSHTLVSWLVGAAVLRLTN